MQGRAGASGLPHIEHGVELAVENRCSRSWKAPCSFARSWRTALTSSSSRRSQEMPATIVRTLSSNVVASTDGPARRGLVLIT